MKLTEDEKLLYDSCEGYIKRFIIECGLIDAYICCTGDDNALELCNRCPYYNPLTKYKEETGQNEVD